MKKAQDREKARQMIKQEGVYDALVTSDLVWEDFEDDLELQELWAAAYNSLGNLELYLDSKESEDKEVLKEVTDVPTDNK